MKRVRILKIILLIITAFALSVVSVSCVVNSNKHTSLKDSLTFVESINIPHQEVSVYSEDIITTNQSLDCYKDNQENLYYFIPNTDTQCGYSKKYYYGFHMENPISIEEAISIANSYLNEKVESFNDYTLILSEHSATDAVYHIQYSYKINGFVTQDLINIFIQENGEIGAYLIPHMNMFKDVVADTGKINTIPSEGDLLNEYITINSEGVILVRYLNIRNESDQLESVQKSYLLNPTERGTGN